MKKGALLTILILLIIPSIIAIEVTPSKETYQPQELFQAQITGNFISLTKDNVFIFKDGKVHAEPTIKSLTKQDNIYYFYATLPNEEGNFSLRITGTRYLERGVIYEEDINTPIEIILKNDSDLSINQGFIIPNEDFEIKVKSLYKNTDLTAKFELTGQEINIPLTEQVEETLKFTLPNLPPQTTKITINNYEIPVFLIKKFNGTNPNLEFIPHIIEGTILPNNEYNFVVLIKNPRSTPIENVILESNLDTTFSPSSIELIEANKTAFVNLTIKIDEIEEDVSSLIIAKHGNEEFYLPIEFRLTEDQNEVVVNDATNEDPVDSNSNILSCSQLGTICTNDQFCDGDTVESLEGPCCIGFCEAQESSSSSTWIGIILFIILIAIVAYIIWRYRKKKNLKSAEQILEEKKVKYKERMKGKEVNKRLDSV